MHCNAMRSTGIMCERFGFRIDRVRVVSYRVVVVVVVVVVVILSKHSIYASLRTWLSRIRSQKSEIHSWTCWCCLPLCPRPTRHRLRQRLNLRSRCRHRLRHPACQSPSDAQFWPPLVSPPRSALPLSRNTHRAKSLHDWRPQLLFQRTFLFRQC